MSWRTRINGKGKFRDAEFLVDSDALGFGRRNQVHEYPLRDIPYVEDIGKKAREFNIEVVVIGPDYDQARDKLIAAIEKPGAGTLVHPYYGTVLVSITSARVRQTTRQGGKASFSLTCVPGEGEPRYPLVTTNTAEKVDAAASDLIRASTNLFGRIYDVSGMIDDYVSETIDQVSSALGDVENVIGDISGNIASVIRAPAELGAVIAGSLSRIRSLVNDPARALAIYHSQTSAGSNATSTTTPQRQQQSTAINASNDLIRQVALAEAVRTSSEIDFATSDDAQKTSLLLLDSIDALMLGIGDDELYQSMRTLRTTMVNDLHERGAQLPSLKRITLSAAQPALLIAHQLYTDTEREAEILSRNNVRHPGFVPGGQPLEVISE